MEVNDAGQEVHGGVPQTRLSVSDIITYFGAIVHSTSEGDLYSWDGESGYLRFFEARTIAGVYDFHDTIECLDIEGKSLEVAMEYMEDNFG